MEAGWRLIQSRVYYEAYKKIVRNAKGPIYDFLSEKNQKNPQQMKMKYLSSQSNVRICAKSKKNFLKLKEKHLCQNLPMMR